MNEIHLRWVTSQEGKYKSAFKHNKGYDDEHPAEYKAGCDEQFVWMSWDNDHR
jgi:hypothetical protein